MENQRAAGTQSQDDLEVLISEQLGSGKNRTEVVRNLVQSGMTESEAAQAVERIYFQLKKAASEEEFSGGALVPGILGGVLAAVIGGAVWAGIAIASEYELGILAWGIGLICGLGVIMFASGKKGMPLQIVAVVTSALGIVIGKYGTFYYYFQDGLLQAENGAALAAEYGLLSLNMFLTFVANLPAMAGIYDLLWIGLAMYTAWGIPKASGLKI
jgi:hypothetical protein